MPLSWHFGGGHIYAKASGVAFADSRSRLTLKPPGAIVENLQLAASGVLKSLRLPV